MTFGEENDEEYIDVEVIPGWKYAQSSLLLFQNGDDDFYPFGWK